MLGHWRAGALKRGGSGQARCDPGPEIAADRDQPELAASEAVHQVQHPNAEKGQPILKRDSYDFMAVPNCAIAGTGTTRRGQRPLGPSLRIEEHQRPVNECNNVPE